MKNILLLLSVSIFCATSSFAQFDITFGIPDVDVTTLSVGDDVVVPVTMVERVPTGVAGSFVIGFDLFLGFDHAILTWKGTNPAPLTGAQNFHPMCAYSAADWTFNDNGAEMVALWQDPTYLGADFENGAVLFEYIFTYEGGLEAGDSSPLVWGVSKSLQAQSEGDIKMEKGITNAFTDGFVNFDNVFLSDGSVFVPLALANTWEGDDVIVPDDWFTAENWSAGTVPTTEDVVIPTGLGNYPFIMGGLEATCGALTIETGAFIQLSYDGYLTAMGNTMCDGDLDIMSDNLGNSGSFIDNGTIAGAGNLMFARDIISSAPVGDEQGWHFISSPLGTSYTNYDMYDYYVNTWDETVPTFIQHAGSPTIPCTPSAEITLNPMMGWSVKQDLDYMCETTLPGTGSMLHFDGAITDVNTGAQSIAASYTANASAYDGYNLVGNPYTSGVEASSIVFDTDLDGSVNTWNAGTHQYDEWTAAAGAYVIAPTQGFWVMATAPTTFDLAGTERAHGGMFYKESLDNVLQLSVTGNGSYDETFVRFMEGTSAGYDLHLDGKKMFSTGMPSLYTTSAGQQLAIDAQEATEQVPMSFSSETPGTYTVEAFETSDFTNVYLQDLQSGIVTDLLAQSHEFNHTDGVQNFIIHFAPVGINEINANTVKIWASDNTIMVNVPADVTGEVVVYNMMGQEVTRTDITSVETQVSVSDVNTNYVVKVISNSNTVTGKVYVK